MLDSFVSHRWWSLLLLLLWTKWNPMILSRFELMVSRCRLYSVQVLSVIRLKINKPKINNDKELKDWAQSIPIENRWNFFFLYHFLVELRFRKFISIVVHTMHNTHAQSHIQRTLNNVKCWKIDALGSYAYVTSMAKQSNTPNRSEWRLPLSYWCKSMLSFWGIR